MIYLLPILLFFLTLAYKLKDNCEKWKIDKPVHHSREWKWYAIAESTTSGLFFITLSDAALWLSIPVSLLMIAWWFWFLFDGFYNLLRKRYAERSGWKLINGQYDWWYTGSEDQDDAVTDNFIQRLKPWQHKAVKIGGIILFTTLYILL